MGSAKARSVHTRTRSNIIAERINVPKIPDVARDFLVRISFASPSLIFQMSIWFAVIYFCCRKWFRKLDVG